MYKELACLGLKPSLDGQQKKITHVISLGSENWCYVSVYWLVVQIEWKYLCKNAWKTHNVA